MNTIIETIGLAFILISLAGCAVATVYLLWRLVADSFFVDDEPDFEIPSFMTKKGK